ncbi:hypothetical protein P389DRAFT_9760 [Cystobasidium minutum MCA 4210]|uniref:uncharacterized protein n=1 Tax=Cystobasidium minutum MCA 4210 TaxID=1397322 RepID=UPI0034CFB5E5|eukprot:jgi/Rhomi1/9760/CE9759_868
MLPLPKPSSRFGGANRRKRSPDGEGRDLPRLSALSNLLSFAGGGNASGNDNADEQPRLPSLRSLNILPPSPSTSTSSTSAYPSSHQLHNNGPLYPARLSSGQPETDTQSWASTEQSSSFLDHRLRHRSNTSASSSLTSLTTSSSSYSDRTYSSDRHHATGTEAADPFPWASGPTFNEIQQSRPSTSSSASTRNSQHPFSGIPMGDQLRHPRLESQVSLELPPLDSLDVSSDLPSQLAKGHATQRRPTDRPSLFEPLPTLSHTFASQSSSTSRQPYGRVSDAQMDSEPLPADSTLDQTPQHLLPVNLHHSRSFAPIIPRVPSYAPELRSFGYSPSSSLNLQPFVPRRVHSSPYESKPVYHPYFPFHRIDQPSTSSTNLLEVPPLYPSRRTFSSSNAQPLIYNGSQGGPPRSRSFTTSDEDTRGKPVGRRRTSFGSRAGATTLRDALSRTQIQLGAESEIHDDGLKEQDNRIPTKDPDKPFACPGCDRSFARRYDRNRHARKHTGEKPYICANPDCEEDFVRPDALQRHYKSNSRCEAFRR